MYKIPHLDTDLSVGKDSEKQQSGYTQANSQIQSTAWGFFA